mmetsp:Transcript_58411/g.164967  ORF Transcript_58411/g.164967 Transcript_58411/m.164967 type:complete len:218 (-) Transcript_58411:591-1244(-)
MMEETVVTGKGKNPQRRKRRTKRRNQRRSRNLSKQNLHSRQRDQSRPLQLRMQQLLQRSCTMNVHRPSIVVRPPGATECTMIPHCMRTSHCRTAKNHEQSRCKMVQGRSSQKEATFARRLASMPWVILSGVSSIRAAHAPTTVSACSFERLVCPPAVLFARSSMRFFRKNCRPSNWLMLATMQWPQLRSRHWGPRRGRRLQAQYRTCPPRTRRNLKT